MTKNDIAHAVAKRLNPGSSPAKMGAETKRVQSVIDAVTEEIKQALTEGKTVWLRDFGTFAPRKQAQKVARVIMTGETVIVPERHVPGFKPADKFRQAVIDSKKN